MKILSTILSFIAFSIVVAGQSPLVKRMQLKRLELENHYKSVGYFDTLTAIATVYEDGYMGYIDSSGKLIVPIKYSTRDFSDGFGIYNNYQEKRHYVINRNGDIIRTFKNLESLHGFKNGLSRFGAQTDGGVKYGVLDLDSNVIIENKYPYIDRISSKYYYVNSFDGSGIINSKGDTIIPIKYIISYVDTTDLHFIGYNRDVGYGLFDSTGHLLKFWGNKVYVKQSSIEGAHYFQRDSVIILQDRFSPTEAKTALLNLNLDTIVPMGKFHMESVNEGMILFYDSFATTSVGTRYRAGQIRDCGFLNTKGEIVIPASFDFAQYFTEGLAAIRRNSKWGYIDKKGKVVIPLKFDYALPFRGGYAKVQIKERFYIINSRGEIVLPSKQY